MIFLFRKYERGRFLGKGGFAKCYELKDVVTGEIMAGKIVPKSLLVKSHQKEKMAQLFLCPANRSPPSRT